MSIIRSDSPYSTTRIGARVVMAHEEIRRADRSDRVGTGTLACPACDAPVAIAGALAPSDTLTCPFCETSGPLRDFLSLAAPVRPARVSITVRRR